ncbi:hypothetical protein JTB14_008859 [Gonioctena quinquepunctata]|nr:hypothetical protein JTB14_008859 [Gonioctena quinquepunctata]
MLTEGDNSGDTKHQLSNDNSGEVSRSEQQEITCYSLQTERFLLSTALVAVKDHQGISRNIRVLLDSGRQSNFMSEIMCNELGLTKTPIEAEI